MKAVYFILLVLFVLALVLLVDSANFAQEPEPGATFPREVIDSDEPCKAFPNAYACTPCVNDGKQCICRWCVNAKGKKIGQDLRSVHSCKKANDS